jgi:phosphoserine phosphatase RsbX
VKLVSAYQSLPKIGEKANGDQVLVRQEDGRVLLAVIDGLGHGPGAEQASQLATQALAAVSLSDSLLKIMEIMDAKLVGSRGAAGSVVLFREGKSEACVVGNVEVRSSELRFPLVFSAGILGGRVRKFHTCCCPLKPARVVLFSDGVSSRTPFDDLRNLDPVAVCDAVMRSYRRKEDDATVLVADVE